jgi:hypothetical protein
MSAEVAQNDGGIGEGTSVDEAESKLRERYPDATYRVFETTGTIHVIIGQDEIGENNCREIGAVDAPDGWKFETVSLHAEGEMMATFERVVR